MSEKQMSARVMNLCLTEAEWSTNYANFIPKKGELVIYDVDSTHVIARFKIGDGTTSVNNLPFRSIDGGYEGLTEILPRTTLHFTSNSLYFIDCPPIEEGKKYTVTFDNTKYELVGELHPYYNYIFIGWGSPNSGEPFLIFNSNSSTPTICISSSETFPCTHTIKIESNGPIKIPEKYLDLKNSNIVNGSKSYSLRTTGSSNENSSYTIGLGAFAEGYGTQASGDYSHAEGSGTTASGNSSHAEGTGTTASGNFSHVEGANTIASSMNQHVQGIFNIEDKNNTYADIIGNGENPSRLSNAATVDWKGNAWYAGDVYVGSTSGTNKDEGSKKLATEEYVNSAISSSGGSGIAIDSELSSTSVNPVQNKVINTALGTKVDKVSGKGLSTNDYTSADKTKLSGIESGANKTVVDTALSDTSENPVQNKVIKSYIDTQLVAITADEIDSICV